MILRRYIWVLPLLLLTSIARATYLRLIPTYQMHIDERGRKISIHWTVKNDGDEAAEAVGLDFPSLGRAYTLASELAPQGRASKTVIFSFSSLGIGNRGDYSLVYRVTYKDTNLFPFSAPHLVLIPLPPEAGRVLSMQSGRPGNELTMTQQGEGKIRVLIRNTSQRSLSLEKVEPLSPVEVSLRTQDLALPLRLLPDEEKKILVSVQTSQTLIGSVYSVGLVASGVVEGTHFSEPMTFLIRIKEGFWSPRNILIAVLLGISVVWIIVQLKTRHRVPEIQKRTAAKRPAP